jgi:LuxR family maltose regulon positive regulatory protein
VDEGEPMRRLLLDGQLLFRQRAAGPADSSTLSLLAYGDRLLAAFPPPISTASPANGMGIEPLSPRELQILRLISSGLSNEEIAVTLVIALSTVKSHINSLYGKLGVQRRTQALSIAHDLGLLPD